MRVISNPLTLASCLLILSACGGGGGSDSPTPPVVTNQPPTLTVDAAASTMEGVFEVATVDGSDPENQSLDYSLSGVDSDQFELSAGGVISFKVVPDYEAPTDADANNDYDITVEVADSQGASDSEQLLIIVTNAIEGRVIDAPLANSPVFIDLNGNMIADAGEPSGTSDANGYFAIAEPEQSDNAQLVALGGTDIMTGVAMTDLALIADLPQDLASPVAISPISSVIASASTVEAKAAVMTALGIEGTVDDFLAQDIWALAESDDETAQRLQAVNQQIALLITTAQALSDSDSPEQVFAVAQATAQAIVTEIGTTGGIDLESSSQLVDVLSDALNNEVSVLMVAAVADNVAEINELLAGDGVDPTSAAATDFVQTTQTDLLASVTDLVEGVTSLVDFVTDTSLVSLFSNSEIFTSQVDTDNDGIVNLLDSDDDGDNVADNLDAFPLDSTESVDTDGDQIGNNADTDDDGDNVPDSADLFPLDASESADIDGDGIGDNADTDDAVQTVYVSLNSDPFAAPYYLFSSTEGGAPETLALERGKTYQFVRVDDGHPFNIGSDWQVGLNDLFMSSTSSERQINGIGSIQLGQSLIISIPADYAGTSVSYYCWTHPSMVAAIQIIDTPVDPGMSEGDTPIMIDGVVADVWGGDLNFSAFDEANGYGDCTDEQAGTESCNSIDWEVVSDAEKGDVLQVSYTSNAGHAGIVVGPGPAVNLSDYSAGQLEFDIKVLNAGANGLSSGFYIKLETNQDSTSGELAVSQIAATGDWEAISIPMSTLTASGGLNLNSVTAPLVFFPAYGTSPGVVYQMDNVRFSGIADGATPPVSGTGPIDPDNPSSFSITAYGAGSVADGINPNSYRCVYDYGNWIYNAGVVEPGIAACNTDTGIPSGTPTAMSPQLTGPALDKPTPTHKWWGSIPFLGEMQTGNANQAAYITPDPFMARVTEKGVRVLSIPAGLGNYTDGFMYPIPDPFTEVFDGMAVGNTAYSNLNAYLKDYSDGSVTVMWKSGNTDVMEATFVHGSPYIYFKAYEGDLVLRTLRADSGEKGTFHNQGNSLGIWTSVAGNLNNFLVTGEGDTSFSNISGNSITVTNATKELTLTYLPATGAGNADSSMISYFEAQARNVVAKVDIDYSVDRNSNTVTVSHSYMDAQGATTPTIVGMHPLHWKNSSQQTSSYKVRSARGMIKFGETDSFSYDMPFVGVLPTMPSIDGTFDQATLENLVTQFIDQGPEVWNDRTDTYWAGKNYGKVAELAAIADSIGMDAAQTQLIDWLKVELADWFTANTTGAIDTNKYFAYDSEWNTLLGFEESFGSHQRLADHHFHYGYFVRAASEICRVDIAWCGDDQYGPMIELLIRDYAADDDDEMFPSMRNFDPANGFSWADGRVNFTRGNNNESTSEAATAYGAIILYGLTTGNDALVEKGMYLHASTSSTYWEYWNNIDGYNNVSADADNFPAGYGKITTSIIWGDGAVFSTWFSAAYAHILGIQGLPSSPLILHVSQYADYMEDYVALGLSQSSNGKPSGLVADQWRDLWWNLWAMVDADAAIADYNSAASYIPEAGETKAHTYHWIHTFSALGQLQTGTGALTADHPAALAFEKDGVTNYVVYNFTDQPLSVSYSDGQTVTAAPNSFALTSN